MDLGRPRSPLRRGRLGHRRIHHAAGHDRRHPQAAGAHRDHPHERGDPRHDGGARHRGDGDVPRRIAAPARRDRGRAPRLLRRVGDPRRRHRAGARGDDPARRVPARPGGGRARHGDRLDAARRDRDGAAHPRRLRHLRLPGLPRARRAELPPAHGARRRDGRGHADRHGAGGAHAADVVVDARLGRRERRARLRRVDARGRHARLRGRGRDGRRRGHAVPRRPRRRRPVRRHGHVGAAAGARAVAGCGLRRTVPRCVRRRFRAVPVPRGHGIRPRDRRLRHDGDGARHHRRCRPRSPTAATSPRWIRTSAPTTSAGADRGIHPPDDEGRPDAGRPSSCVVRAATARARCAR